jgi:2Fe-2S ferredoxin
MPSIHVIRRDGSALVVEAAAGQSLKDALMAGGVDEVLALCGGFASCGTCHVHVAEDWFDRLPVMGADEEDLLGYSDWRQPNSRLACQVAFTDALHGITVTVAPED